MGITRSIIIDDSDTAILGSKTDAKSTATDTTAASVVSVLKQISASVQASAAANPVSTSEYETVAASQTAQVLGATGATGDYISHVLVVPATLSPGNILLLDNATSITIFAGGTSSITSLTPFAIPLGMTSVSGAWKLTTGANVSAIGIGNFT